VGLHSQSRASFVTSTLSPGLSAPRMMASFSFRSAQVNRVRGPGTESGAEEVVTGPKHKANARKYLISNL
jgi:hypothetical protein